MASWKLTPRRGPDADTNPRSPQQAARSQGNGKQKAPPLTIRKHAPFPKVRPAPELFHGGIHRRDRGKVFDELCETVDEWIVLMEEDGRALPAPLAGKEFSSKFLLRVDPELHRLLAIRALQEGDSLNAYVAKRLRTAA